MSQKQRLVVVVRGGTGDPPPSIKNKHTQSYYQIRLSPLFSKGGLGGNYAMQKKDNNIC